MTNLPKELQEIRDNNADTYEYEIKGARPISANESPRYPGYCDIGQHYKNGFNSCYQAMLKTHVPREKVEKLVNVARSILNLPVTTSTWGAKVFLEDTQISMHEIGELYAALKEFESADE